MCVHAKFLHGLRENSIKESRPGWIGATKETGVKLPSLPHGHINNCLVTASKRSLFTFALDRVRVTRYQRKRYE